MTVNANIDIRASATETKAGALGNYQGVPSITFTKSLSTSDISKCYQLNATIATAQTYDVNSGLVDAFGTALVFATVKSVVIRNNDATASLVVGGGTNPLFVSDQYTIKAGQCLAITSSFTVNASTAKVITLTPSASLNFDLLLLGS